MAEVERCVVPRRGWPAGRRRRSTAPTTSPDGDFDDVADADAEADFATFQAEVEAAGAAVAGVPLEHDLRAPGSRTR